MSPILSTVHGGNIFEATRCHLKQKAEGWGADRWQAIPNGYRGIYRGIYRGYIGVIYRGYIGVI